MRRFLQVWGGAEIGVVVVMRHAAVAAATQTENC